MTLTVADSIWIFIICVGIPLGYGIGYFGLMLVLDLWAHHKKDCRGPHMPRKYHPAMLCGGSSKPIGMQITLRTGGPLEGKE